MAIKQVAVQEQDHEKNAAAQKDAKKWVPPSGLQFITTSMLRA